MTPYSRSAPRVPVAVLAVATAAMIAGLGAGPALADTPATGGPSPAVATPLTSPLTSPTTSPATSPTATVIGDKTCPGYGGQFFPPGSPCPPPPPAVVTVRGARCVDGATTVDVTVRGAVPGADYALYGTSLYVASDPFPAPAATFSRSIRIGHGYRGFSGDLEAMAIQQTSNMFTVADRCEPARSPLPRTAPSTPARSTASTPPAHLVTFTYQDSNFVPTSEPADAAPATTSGLVPVAAAASTVRHHSSTAEVLIIVAAAVLAVATLVTGGLVARRRSH